MRRALLTLLLLTSSAFAGLPVKVESDDPNLVYMGRFSGDHQFGWTATGFRFKTTAIAVEAELELTASKRCALQVVVDGKPTKVLYLAQGKKAHVLAEKLAKGEHVIEVWKRTEGFLGQVKFGGLHLSEGGKLLPLKPHDRRILIVGDSISCGYGSEAKDVKEGNTVQNENGYMAYGPIAARALNAELMMVCWSGKGLYRDRSAKNDTTETMPKIFDRALPMNKEETWDHSKFVPHVVVINLGTNDVFRGKGKVKPELTKEMYLGAYREFIKRLRALFPDVKIIASIGPMAYQPMSDWLPALAKDDPNTGVLIYSKGKGMEYVGGHWHPSVKMHRQMARELQQKLRTVCGW